MAIEDHVNLIGGSPLRGPNLEELGPRFPDMTRPYDAELLALAHRLAAEAGVPLKQGVYLATHGPQYETPAEIRMMRALGADAVGMSTVPEVIVARHMGMRVVGISCITNMAAGMGEAPLSHQEVMETSQRVQERFVALLRRLVGRMGR
jgi:purine-nucleoside phosphorylase